MTTMLIICGVVVAVCAVLGFIVNLEDGDLVEAVFGSFAGAWVGFCLAGVVAFWWIVIHFIGKYW